MPSSASLAVLVLLGIVLSTPVTGCAAPSPQAGEASGASQTVPVPPPSTTDAGRYVETAPTRDGIGKTYHGREIARVMGYAGAEWLERPERAREERPDVLLSILEELGAEPGAVVADVGAGSGVLTIPLARRVGSEGRVYAVDVQQEMLDRLGDRLAEENLANVIPVLAGEDDPRLPPDSVDLAFLVDVYHELAYPHEVMSRLVDALKPGGRVVLVEYRGEDPDLPIKALHKMTEEQVRREMADLAVTYVETRDELPVQHVLVFEK